MGLPFCCLDVVLKTIMARVADHSFRRNLGTGNPFSFVRQ